ncbi:MAG: flagellar hook-associated protein FlgK [Lachnospiraceae bacterium]|nr:flagellar hook-associated protein FlgK [Lachnospiraceae bacterium]
MPSQFFGLNIAYKGLLASNAALNTTANNIANVQTDGYSRQRVVQQASQAIRVFQTYGCAGAGVDTLAIERVRDEFYDTKYWNNNANAGEYNIKQYYMQQIEAYFKDDGLNTGFKTIFDKMMIGGIQEWKKDPSSTNAKKQFIGTVGQLTEYFNGLAGNMQKLQADVNQEIKIKVDEINSLAGEIATLNKQINVVELSGSKANELRDRRSLLLDQLSLIVDVETKEYPIMDLNQPDRETGAHNFIVKIAGGQTLVDGTEYNGLECVARASYEKVNQTDIDGLYDVYWADGQKFNLYNPSMGGNLQGLVQMRDGNNGEYFNGKIESIGRTDDDKHDTVTVSVTQKYLQDLNFSNLSDQGGVISLGNREYYYDSWTYECSYNDKGEKVCSYTFTLSDSTLNPQRLTNDRVGKNAEVGTGLKYQGVPYYMNQMNIWIRTFAQKFNDTLKSGYNTYGDLGCNLLTGNMSATSEQYNFVDDFRYDTFTYEAYQERVKELVQNGMSQADAEKAAALKVSDDADSYYHLTAMNFDVSVAVELDPDLLSHRYEQGDGVEQDVLLDDLKRIATDTEKMSFRGGNASEFLQCILGDIALNASRANTFQKNFSDISEIINTQRMSISGVDEDEEAVNLVKYQHAYGLSSKMIQVLTEVYDRLILETGV